MKILFFLKPSHFFVGTILLFIFLGSAFLIAGEKDKPIPPPEIVPDKIIQQRFSRPLLLDRQTIIKSDSIDAALLMNLDQNTGRLPGSGFQASQKISSRIKAVYENSLLLPYWAETVSSERYLHENRINLEWNLLSKTSLETSYVSQSEFALDQQKNIASETRQKNLGLKGKGFKQSLWETGYRRIETQHDQSINETNLWYAKWNQPISSKLGLVFQSEYRESGDPNQDLYIDDKRLQLGSGANFQINDNFSAQLRFDLKMQEELQNSNRNWTPEEKRISFSVKGVF